MNAIRPISLDQFVGQESSRRILTVLIGAAKKRGEPVPHLLMSGPAGLGKTTLARIVAHEMGGRLIEVIASSVKNVADMTHYLMQPKSQDVLFINLCLMPAAPHRGGDYPGDGGSGDHCR